MTILDISQDGFNWSNSLDLAMSVVGFVPGIGWAISGTYFITDLAIEATTGKDIGEHIQGW